MLWLSHYFQKCKLHIFQGINSILQKKMLQKKYLKNLSEMQASYSQRDKLNSAKKKKTYTLPNFVVVIYIYY